MDKYEKWISDFIEAGNEIHGMCCSTCELMQKDFPELTLRGGYVETALGNDLHFWLISPEGDIVDPTEEQFGGLQPEDYVDSGLTTPNEILKWYLDLSNREFDEFLASQ